jgi:hypothetical protein
MATTCGATPAAVARESPLQLQRGKPKHKQQPFTAGLMPPVHSTDLKPAMCSLRHSSLATPVIAHDILHRGATVTCSTNIPSVKNAMLHLFNHRHWPVVAVCACMTDVLIAPWVLLPVSVCNCCLFTAHEVRLCQAVPALAFSSSSLVQLFTRKPAISLACWMAAFTLASSLLRPE